MLSLQKLKRVNIMIKKKQIDKEQLVDELMDLYEDRHNENGWNNNDAFDVACWFLGNMIVQLEADHLIPRAREELERRGYDLTTVKFSIAPKLENPTRPERFQKLIEKYCKEE